MSDFVRGFLATIYSFLLVGCIAATHMTENPNYPIDPLDVRITPTYIDPNLPQKQTLNAIREWNHAMNGSYIFDVVPWDNNPKPPAVVIRAAHTDNADLRRGGKEAVGVTYPWDGNYPSSIIYLDIDNLGYYPYTQTVEHELGHAFGADHKENTLMGERLSNMSRRCIDQPTLHQVAKILHLDERFLNHC